MLGSSPSLRASNLQSHACYVIYSLSLWVDRETSSVPSEKTETVIAALNVNFRCFIRYLLTRINNASLNHLSFNVLLMVTSHEKG